MSMNVYERVFESILKQDRNKIKPKALSKNKYSTLQRDEVSDFWRK